MGKRPPSRRTVNEACRLWQKLAAMTPLEQAELSLWQSKDRFAELAQRALAGDTSVDDDVRQAFGDLRHASAECDRSAWETA